MRPTRVHYVLGHSLKIAAWVGAGTAVAATLWIGIPACRGVGPTILVCISVLAAALLGCIAGTLILWPILYKLGSRLNGAPFCSGDVVRILVGRHRDRVTKVYEVWTERMSARVELGDEERKSVTDVFTFNQICREEGLSATSSAEKR